jgi:sulfite reductase alpha subunit-like flavoprotein
MELDLDDKMLTDIVGSNLETAILYSFEKNGFTIVDPMTVGKSFLTHCARERTAGRECPAQWSWIGGLVGPNNPTWHLEMRDFMKNPQYDYCCNPWEVVKSDASIQINKKFDDDDGDGRKEDDSVIIPNVIIAFGSETGTAEAAASSLARKLRFCKTTVLSLNELVSSDLLQKCTEGTKYLFVICSTFGRGMLPNNAKSFLEIELAKDVCSQFKYAVLALGSSLYPDFCKAGKDVDEKLNASGAGELIKIEMADASQNGDVTISKWITQVEKTVLPSTLVQQLMSLSSKTEDSLDDVCYRMKWQVGSFRKSALKEESGLMLCKQNLELFIDGNINSRSTRHIELELPDGVTYESGDHLMVKPLNDINTVKRLCKCFTYELTNAAVLSGYNKLDNNLESKTSPIEFQMNVPFSILSFPSEKERKDGQTEGTLFRSPNLMDRPLIEVLARFSDLSFVHISYVVDLLTMLLQKSKAIARDDKMASNFVQIAESILNAYIKGKTKSIENFVAKFPTIVELLEKFNSLFCVPRGNDEDPLLSIADILVLMPGLQPRYYSISSASEVTPRSITLTVGVVNEKTALGRNVKGVCSHYLAGLCPGDTIQATIVTSSFRLPMKRHHPLVFIGAGTGLAPIMGFLRERSHQFDKYRSSSFGECHLFFGCRDEDEFLYRDQLLEWEKRGILKLHIAFSRSKFCNKQYVQDSLTNYGSDLVDLLLSKDETFVYICGAAHIANECSDKCIELIGKHANMSRINAMHFMMKLRVEGRWELDVWGDVKSLHSVQEERTKNLFTSSLKAATLHKSDIDNVISGK